MKTFIITQIANNFRKRLPIARNIKPQHLAYMYRYTYRQLFFTLVDSFSAKPNHFNDRFIKNQ